MNNLSPEPASLPLPCFPQTAPFRQGEQTLLSGKLMLAQGGKETGLPVAFG